MTKISEELLDEIVNALTHLPYRDVQHIFVRLAQELSQPQGETTQIIHPPH